jgi:TolB-like protein/DNA-binding winged helix-turn-helix (wHTH) protein/Tfp pilus assembly protein PilF
MNGPGPKAGLLRFGTFELDRASGELRRSGTLVKLQSQQFELLALLAERAGQVVTREEIRQALWDDETFVDFDRSINFCVNQIRGALGDDPQRPRFVETLPRKGYRFIAPVAQIPVLSQAEEARSNPSPDPVDFPKPIQAKRWWLPGAAAGLALITIALASKTGVPPAASSIKSLAVLPLENLSNDPEQEYFADGMTDELITDLAKISALRVISRTSVMRYKGTKEPVPEIARELNVDAVLEGTVTRDQGRVRITAQLIAASPEKHLWAEKYEASFHDLLNVQDLVAKAVAREIQIKMTPVEQKLLAGPRAIDPEAYEAYLKGRYLSEHPTEENLRNSRTYLERSIGKDPGYAVAWAGLASTYNQLGNWGVATSQEARPRARAAAEKALELDGSLVGPLVELANVKRNYEWDWAGAERLYKRAIELRPSNGAAHHAYATYLAEVGRVGEAVAEERRARDADPLSPEFGANVAWKLYLARRYDEAEQEYRGLTQWNPRDTGDYILASVYLQTGRQREALAELRKSVAESHHGVLELMFLGRALGITGARAEGKQVLDEMLGLSQQRCVPPEYIANVYEGLGERGQALQWFEKAVAERSMNGWLLPDPQLDPIRREPRFRNLMRRMGLAQ